MTRTILLVIVLFSSNILGDETIGNNSGKPIPRFISIKSSEANLRIGPNMDYPKVLKYIYKNIPLMVIDEYNQWRKVIDWETNEGWIHISLLSSKRYGIVKKNEDNYAHVYSKPNRKIKGKIGHSNIVKINKCAEKWCEIKINKFKGWVKKSGIWGVFEYEDFD